MTCPKCDHPIVFDDSGYPKGMSVVFECDSCRKSFTIRIGEELEEYQEEDLGHVVVIENYQQIAFCIGQVVESFVCQTAAH